MSPDSLDTWELSQLVPNTMSLLILAILTVSLLVLSPWGLDLLYSGLAHFFMLWTLALLAILTYIAKIKLTEEEREVPARR